MLNPAIGKLIEKCDNRYELVMDVANEARNISELATANGEIIVENYEGTDEIIEKVAYVNSEEYLANQMAQNEARAHFEIKEDEE